MDRYTLDDIAALKYRIETLEQEVTALKAKTEPDTMTEIVLRRMVPALEAAHYKHLQMQGTAHGTQRFSPPDTEGRP